MKKYEIRYNKRNKRHVVFEVPKTKGLWKIKTSFRTKKEANAWVKKMSKPKGKGKK